jgi:hypothetical protein
MAPRDGAPSVPWARIRVSDLGGGMKTDWGGPATVSTRMGGTRTREDGLAPCRDPTREMLYCIRVAFPGIRLYGIA